VGTKAASRAVGRYVGFKVEDVVFGLPVAMVHEFARLEHWVPLRTGRTVLGLTQLRGEVLGLVDLLAGVLDRPSQVGAMMLVFELRGGRAAAPVSEVLGTRAVTESDLAPPEQLVPQGPAVAHVTRDLWLLLDATAVRAALDGR
jgi:chemotaxis signal transduction protein